MVTSPKYIFETLFIWNLCWKALHSSRLVSRSYSKTTVGFQSLNYRWTCGVGNVSETVM